MQRHSKASAELAGLAYRRIKAEEELKRWKEAGIEAAQRMGNVDDELRKFTQRMGKRYDMLSKGYVIGPSGKFIKQSDNANGA